MFFQRIHINTVTDRINMTAGFTGCQLDIVLTIRLQWLFRHPHHIGQHVLCHLRFRIRCDQQITTADVDFIFQRDGYGLTRQGVIQITIESDNAFNFALFT